MAQDLIDQLQELCGRLREQLMQQPEYRALVSLERTIEDLSLCVGRMPAAAEPPPVAMHDIDAGISMRQGAEQVAEALADALQRKPARPADHLPSHRVA